MLETTGDLKLKKIELTDTPDITVINPNWDKLDEEVTRSKTNIGNITQLTTQNKTSLVHAINEIDTKKIAKTQIKNNLTETVEGNVLDATMGKALKEDVDDRALKTEVGALSGLTTTAKTSLVDAINESTNKINVLSDKLNWKPNNWKTDEALPSEYPNKQTVYFYADSFGPFKNVNVETIKESNNFVKQSLFGINGEELKYRLTNIGGTWGEWQSIATTTKTDILCTSGTGFKITHQNCWIENNYMYINVDVMRTSETAFDINQSLNLINLPRRPKTTTVIQAECHQTGAPARYSCGAIAHDNTGLYITVQNSGCTYVTVSGVIAI